MAEASSVSKFSFSLHELAYLLGVSNIPPNTSFIIASYHYDMSVEEAAELARRAIYHATFRDGASGGVASGTVLLFPLVYVCFI